MAKSRSVGARVTPEFGQEIERLKEAFGFRSFGEMLESLVCLLRLIDEGVSKIDRHPREWRSEDVARYLSFGDGNVTGYEAGELAELLWRRLKQRFGEDGVEKLRQLLCKDSVPVR